MITAVFVEEYDEDGNWKCESEDKTNSLYTYVTVVVSIDHSEKENEERKSLHNKKKDRMIAKKGLPNVSPKVITLFLTTLMESVERKINHVYRYADKCVCFQNC